MGLSTVLIIQRQYTSPDGEDSTSSTSGSAIDTDGGASGGTSASFDLSSGALIAICIVVALVVIFGIASTVLFILAKRRNWSVRASVRRASRRITGRGTEDIGSGNIGSGDRLSRRAGVQMNTIPATRGHKRGWVVAVQDVERGRQSGNKQQTPKPHASDGGYGFMGK